jgi:hypothetical protein
LIRVGCCGSPTRESDNVVGTINGTTITLDIRFGDFPFQLDCALE